MGKAFDPPLADNLAQWIAKQKIFFVATAPKRGGRVNVSPKSADQFRVVDGGRAVCYLDFTGSGNETAAHILDSNGRITVMFVQLEEGSPRILRLFGKGRILHKDMLSKEFLSIFEERDLTDRSFRCVVYIELERISTSCGYSIPIYSYVRERTTLREVSNKLSPEEMTQYQMKKNFVSIDGLFCSEELLDIPTSIRIEEGFPLAYYNQEVDGRWTYYRIKLKRMLWPLRKYNPEHETFRGFALGVLACLGFMRLFK